MLRLTTTCGVVVALLASVFQVHAGDAKSKEAPAWKLLFDGKSLAGWKVTNFGAEGEVEVRDQAIFLGQGDPMTGITYDKKDFPTSNYEVTLEGKRLAGLDFFCTTTFPVGKDHCSLVMGGWGGTVVGLSSIDGKDASENDTRLYKNFTKDQWYRVRIRVTDAKIQAWIDDGKVIDLDIRGKKLSLRVETDLCKPFGISTWRTAGAVRNIRVRTLAADELKSSQRRPNILWIVAENIDTDLGCYGAKNVHTPHLDKLAAAGARCTRVFATAPVCAPSRSAFMTGMYQTTTDTHHMRSHRDDAFRLPPGVRPVTHWLEEAGYSTFNIRLILRWLVGTGKLDLNFVNEGKIFQSDDWSALKTKQPFFAQINTPEAEYDIYDRKSASKPRVEWVGEREHAQIAKPENVTPPPYYPDHPITRQEWARYLNSVSGLDQRVGRVLEALRTDGLEDDTIVIFFADNGRLEARGIHLCYDSGLRVPMIIRWPKNFPAPANFQPGTVNEQVISLLDLTATTLALAGLERPPGMQGRIFAGPNADPPRQFAFSARDRIDETVNRIRSVRDERYRYIRNFMPPQSFTALNRYKEKCFLVLPLMRQLHAEGKLTGPALALMAPRLPDEELYDTQADPHEMKNLAQSQEPEHQQALARLRAALEVWMTETGDRGQFPEPADVVAPFEKEMHDWFGTPAWHKR